jgi:hypothetical protein
MRIARIKNSVPIRHTKVVVIAILKALNQEIHGEMRRMVSCLKAGP